MSCASDTKTFFWLAVAKGLEDHSRIPFNHLMVLLLPLVGSKGHIPSAHNHRSHIRALVRK
jgi:hypothetical protein